jgi:hypothetical protein
MKIEAHKADLQMKAATTQQKMILEDAKAAAKVRGNQTAQVPPMQPPL